MTEPWPFWRSVPRFDREYAWGDLRSALGTLLRAPQEELLCVNKLFSPAFHHFARSGTESLGILLKLLKLRPKSRVGVPLYCCSAVFEAIVSAGHVPVFLEADPSSYGLDAQFLRDKRDALDALVVVHLFGYPNDLAAVRDAISGNDIPIIEDCAHSLFSEYQNRQTGTCTDASFHTFGMHKPAAVGGGAVLVINNPDLANRARTELPAFAADTSTSELRHSLMCLARSITYQRATYGALLASPMGSGRDNGNWTPRARAESSSGISLVPRGIRKVDLVLVARRVEEFRSKLPRLAENTRKLRDSIENTEIFFPAEPTFGKWNHFLVPVRFATPERRDSARRFLTRRRIDTAPLYQNCARNALRFGYTGNCPQAERVARTVCTVPNHSWLSDLELAYIGHSLKQSVGRPEGVPQQANLRQYESGM
jgi:perosamine synthetase